jgi:hypothetical protein
MPFKTERMDRVSPESLTPDALKRLSTAELLALFKTLEAPAIAEMDGEFAACLLQQPSLLATVFGNLGINNPVTPGYWQCKAFRPVGADEGRGYNSFNHLGRSVQRFPMQTLIAPSRYDGRPAYQLVYRAFHSACGDIHMVDEVRRVSAGIYLGIGTWGFTAAQRRIPLPFLLTGPDAPYRGDIGKPRRGFRLAAEIPALQNLPV